MFSVPSNSLLTRRYEAMLAMAAAHLLILAVLIYSCWLATHFTFRFTPLRYLDGYRLQANAFAHGHVYASYPDGRAIEGCIDCMNFREKRYLAYGPFPALIQLVLVNLLKLKVTSAGIVWWICALTLYASFWIVRWYAQRFLNLGLIAATLAAAAFAVGVGTSDLFLHTAAIPFSWSQASACGQLCMLFSLYCFVRGLTLGEWRNLFWSGVWCAFAFLSKQSYTPAFLAGLAALLWTARRMHWNRRELLPRLTRFLAPVFCGILCLLWFNWARFANPFDSGIQYANATDTAPDFKQAPQLRRIPVNLYNHFLAGVEIQAADFPFVRGKSINPGMVLLYNYPMFSVFISVPMLLLLFPGVVYAVKKRFAEPWNYWAYLLLLSGCAFAFFLAYNASWMRYQYDMFFPAAICVFQLAVLALQHGGLFSRTSLAVFLGLCFLEQSALGLDQTVSLFFSRSMPFIHWQAYERQSDERRREKAQEIRSALFEKHPGAGDTVITTDTPQPIPVLPPGSLWLIRNPETLYRKTATGWLRIFTVEPQQQLRVSFANVASGEFEPLLEWGKPPAADALAVQYNSDGTGRFIYAHWGGGSCVSARDFPFDHDRSYHVSILRDRVMQHVEVDLEDMQVLACDVGVYPTNPADIQMGKNADQFPNFYPYFRGQVEVTNQTPTKAAAP